MANYVVENDVLFNDSTIMGDNLEHPYNLKCYDGYAIGVAVDCEENKNVPKKIRILYPLRGDIVYDENKSQKVLKYRGLYDLSAKDINYGDIAICYGKIFKIRTTKKINENWSEFDKLIANKHFNKYNKIYLDEYSCPMDMVEVDMLL